MVLSLATAFLKAVGICLCSPHCVYGPGDQGHGGDLLHRASGWPSKDPVPIHGWAFRAYSKACTVLAAMLTLASLFTLCVDSADFEEVTDGFINFCSLYTTWVYIRVWRGRSADLHYVLSTHQRFLDRYERLWRRDAEQNRFLRAMYRMDTMFTLSLLCTLLGLVALVILQSCLSLVPPLPPVPRLAYAPPVAPGELDPLAASRTLRFALILLFQSPALVCCGVPFAALAAIHFALNTHGIYLMRCLKRSLELAGDDLEGRWIRPWGRRIPVDVIVKQHQHILDMLHVNNNIFARPITERLAITYTLLGLTAYCLSTNPFGDVKVPIIALFMIFSLLLMAVISDLLKDECGTVQEAVWRCEWETAGRQTHKKLILLTCRTQRYSRDGLAAAGMLDRISMTTFVQVMKSSVSFLQALRNFH